VLLLKLIGSNRTLILQPTLKLSYLERVPRPGYQFDSHIVAVKQAAQTSKAINAFIS